MRANPVWIHALVVGCGMIWSSAANSEGSIDSLVNKCEVCHGENGNSRDPDVPIIAGFSYDGFFDTLAAFREDERVAMEFSAPGEPAVVMNDIAKELDDAQVEALAQHFSSQTFMPAIQDFNVEWARAGAKIHEQNCEKCHSDGGSNPQDDAAILAGQWIKYLSRQFDDIVSGKRIVSRKMAKKVKALSAEDKQALVHYYASVGRGASGN